MKPSSLPFLPFLLFLAFLPSPSLPAHAAEVELRNATLEGRLDGETARLVVQATLGGLLDREKDVALHATRLDHTLRVTSATVEHEFAVRAEALRGGLREIRLRLEGPGTVSAVTGDDLADWSVQTATNGTRHLVLRLLATEKPRPTFSATIRASQPTGAIPGALNPLTLVPDPPSLGHGYVRLATAPELAVQTTNVVGLVPVDSRYLPNLSGATNQTPAPATGAVRGFRFHGEAYALLLVIAFAQPEAREIVFSDFKLEGTLVEDGATFELTALARVKSATGGTVELVSGDVALTAPPTGTDWRLRYEGSRFTATFDQPGDYPLRVRFHARVRATNGWNEIGFQVTPGALAPLVLRGLQPDTELRFPAGARPERRDDAFRSFLPANGQVALSWRGARSATEGRLFYSAESVTQIGVGPGLLRQTSLFELKVMQGEMSSMAFRVRGEGEITRVQGPQLFGWEVAPVPGSSDRRLIVRFNQPQRDLAAVQVQVQRVLGAFPLAVEPAALEPEGATRFAGHVRVVNEGAVRLEVVDARGLSQISPEQFIQSEAVKALLPAPASQVFAYRFAGAGANLRIQADNILPELSVSEVLTYRLGETDLSIDAEFEIDVREAPLRELHVSVPRGYGLAQLNAAGVIDQFLADATEGTNAVLRLVYGAPVLGRQVVQFRLERNQPLGDVRWSLPRLEILRARSTRGHVGVLAEAGFRILPGTTTGLIELAPAFFPKRIAGLHAAFRLSDANWQAALAVERLAQSIQADAFHLFSVGEGIAYGSSLINYVVSGAPVSTLAVELSSEYFNVEFTGQNLRNWQKTDRGYTVQLHTPVSGSYTLLVTYERPFKAQGETLAFTGVRPLDSLAEQGYTLVISAYQFEVTPATVSGSLLAIEPGEVPAEYRLFFDAPILAAYRYTARPFQLQLALRPLAQGEIVSQIVDRASLATKISEEGQVVTEARYFVKNKGAPHLRLLLPGDAELWSVTVDGKTVVPVKDNLAHLVPLPTHADPNVVMEVRAKIATRARAARRLSVGAPVVSAPVLLADWTLTPADGRRLVYRGGTLTPTGGIPDASGFAALARALRSADGNRFLGAAGALFLAVLAAAALWTGRVGGPYRRFRPRHLLAGCLGGAATLIALVLLAVLARIASEQVLSIPTDLRFVMPVQQPNVPWRVDLANVPLDSGSLGFLSPVLALGTLALWVAGWFAGTRWWRPLAGAAGWWLLCWAALRLPVGAVPFLIVVGAFLGLRVLLPALGRWWRGPSTPTDPGSAGTTPFEPSSPAPTSAAVLVLIGIGSLLAGPGTPHARAQSPAPTPFAESVEHEIRVEDDQAFGTARVRWSPARGQSLVLFTEPGVLTRSSHPTNQSRLVRLTRNGRPTQVLLVDATGPLDFTLAYEVAVTNHNGVRGFRLPVVGGLVTRARVTVAGQDVDIVAPDAVLVRHEDRTAGSNSVASLVLRPAHAPLLSWQPRTRDTRREKVEFYSESSQLFVPGAGLLEGLHDFQIRPARGEVGELTFEIPAGMTVTDVTAPGLSLWRFDPDTRRLRAVLSPALARAFTVRVRSQTGANPLPFEKSVQPIALEGAAGQVGTVGIATGNEVQLDDVRVDGLAPINLEDFSGSGVETLAAQIQGLALRRAFRFSSPSGTLVVKAAAVEPDVRVEFQQTLSLGEDRTVLAGNLQVDVNRAGIFKLSFPLPAGLDVEAVSGPALSHWTELKSDQARIVTLHLKGKTQGKHAFSVTLVGPGVRSAKGWAVPRLSLREASKHRGQLVVVPEQGLRLQVAAREGATQTDPIQAGLRQKGVMVFRILQDPWSVTLDLDRVDAWLQVTGLQHVTVHEAQVQVLANLQYEIENTGVKSLFVRLPAGADNVRFRGDQVSDFLPTGATNTPLRDWEVKLERRVLGKYALQASYTLLIPPQATQLEIPGIEARDVNLQRGFVTVQSGGRLQVHVDPPAALALTEWQVIPRALLKDIASPSAEHAFRLVEPAFRLPIRLERREATRLLPARVNSVTLTSVVSDDGAVLTQVKLGLTPGDKRLLQVRLPDQARFWFAFVNQDSVWPWQSTNRILLPLEQNARTGEDVTVEFFYTSLGGGGSTRALDLALDGPKFDLPLENVIWTVFLNEKWRVHDTSGTLQWRRGDEVVQPIALDLDTYIRGEAQSREAKTKEAVTFLAHANTLLVQGDPQQARRAFQAAYGMSQGDQAFNEDARVQLNNLKMQQALVGLNVRQARVAGDAPSQAAAAPRALWENRTVNYSQNEAKQLLERNTSEETAVQQRLAERLIQQQDAVSAKPAAIRALLPEQGRRLVFTRPLEVNTWADLTIHIDARAAAAVSWLWRLGLLALVLVALLVLGLLARAGK